MADKIEPALSAEQWFGTGQVTQAHQIPDGGWEAGWVGLVNLPHDEHSSPILAGTKIGDIAVVNPRHATAALCLYQQPFGFTPADLAAIHVVLTLGQVLGIPLGAPAKEQLASLASRIRALLPPSAETP